MKILNLILALSFVSIATTSFAAQDIQVETVKKMYKIAKKTEGGADIIEKYADPTLKRAFAIANKAEDACIESDPMWQSQDPEYNVPLTFTKLANNRVKVNLGKGKWNTPSSVIYQLTCSGNVCKISDVIEGGYSFKKGISECK